MEQSALDGNTLALIIFFNLSHIFHYSIWNDQLINKIPLYFI